VEMIKRKELKEDGRYIIFYEFNNQDGVDGKDLNSRGDFERLEEKDNGTDSDRCGNSCDEVLNNLDLTRDSKDISGTNHKERGSR
jgi:hypothetical protein